MVRQGESFAGAGVVGLRAAADVALLIDGDNVSPSLAPAILDRARNEGEIRVARAYGRAEQLKGWALPGLRRVIDDAAPGRTDMLLAMEAVELALAHGLRRFVIASSDGDFAQLALFLREHGCRVAGVGTPKAPERFRAACHVFADLHEAAAPPKSPPQPAPPVPATSTASAPTPAAMPGTPGKQDKFDMLIVSTLKANNRSLRLTSLNALHQKAGRPQIATTPHKSWRAYLASRPDLYDLDPRGTEARVRLR